MTRSGSFFEEFSGVRDAWATAELEALLERACEQARAEWPGVAVPEAAFLTFLGARVPASAEAPGKALASLHVGDLYLACGCVLGLPAAVSAFVDRYLGAVPQHIARLRVAPAVAEEIRQELSHKLLVASPGEPPRIATFNGSGPLGGWVAVCAQRAALTALGRRDEGATHVGVDQLERALTTSVHPELQIAKAQLRMDFGEAVRSALAALTARERTLLRLSVVSGLSCRKLGQVYNVDAATVSRWNARIREALLGHVQQFLQQRKGIDPAELPSLLGLARSQMELSLSGLLRDQD